MSENLNKYLDIVESNLVRNIQENFDYFTEAFNNFDGMRENMKVIEQKAVLMRQHNEALKKEHLHKMLQVYHLQRQKVNIAKVNEKLKYVTILRQTLPVIANLLETSNFKVVLELLQSS